MNSSNRCKLHVFCDVYVTISDYKNITYVHMRYYDGKYPTKKGVAMPLLRWKTLVQLIPKIQENRNADQSAFEHLGGNCYISITDDIPGIDIRDFWMPEGELKIKATKRGVHFSQEDFDKLVDLIPRINGYIPEFDEIKLYVENDDHQNQQGALRCKECNPNEYHMW
ncbi:uncharacterized protein LOC132736194 [Ruditapes philippinarum]|uniref:uncharacterized protein LOC132736194 n=1 Tax=Ruditapes philippinarum TaxID=129788 RepID=UPI00295BBDA7|nr:uncharacterized protein LOC132736194 [Ruditapes philippinarum]